MNVILMLLVGAVSLGAADFRYQVWRVKHGRDQPGRLEIGEGGVSYVSDNGKTTIHVPLPDIREADVSDPRLVQIETYDRGKRRLGANQVHTFRLRGDKHGEDLVRFFIARLKRPVLGDYNAGWAPLYEIAAYHRHKLGGCHGTLQIGRQGIRFLGHKEEDSRTWLYGDIETVGNMDPYHLRVSTFAETYTFDLKQRLPEEAYRLAAETIYGLSRAAPGL